MQVASLIIQLKCLVELFLSVASCQNLQLSFVCSPSGKSLWKNIKDKEVSLPSPIEVEEY